MQLTNEDLIGARATLQQIKAQRLFQNGRLHYAVCKNLRRLEGEVEDFQEANRQLLDTHAEKDDAGEYVFETPEGERVELRQNGHGKKLVLAGDEERELLEDASSSATAAPEERQQVQARNQRLMNSLRHVFADDATREALVKQRRALLAEEVDVPIHTVPETLLDGEARANEVDLGAIWWMFSDD